MFHKKYDSANAYSMQQHTANEEYDKLFFFYMRFFTYWEISEIISALKNTATQIVDAGIGENNFAPCSYLISAYKK